MEPFFDGGLFELLFAAGFVILVNFIFLKRYLLIIFSVMILSEPVLLYFIRKNELYNWIVALCVFNSVLLVSILWKQKMEKPLAPLFNTEKIKSKLVEFRSRISNLFVRKPKSEKSGVSV